MNSGLLTMYGVSSLFSRLNQSCSFLPVGWLSLSVHLHTKHMYLCLARTVPILIGLFLRCDGANYLIHLPCRVFLIAAAVQLKMTEVTVTILSVIVKKKNKCHFFFFFAFLVFSGDRHWKDCLLVNVNTEHVLQILPPFSVNSFETEESQHNFNEEYGHKCNCITVSSVLTY